MTTQPHTEIDRARAVLFDLDGVVTRTATLHAQAWKMLFDPLIQRFAPGSRPFDAETDYQNYVDGRPRYDGVANVLASRGISLPLGDVTDAPGTLTVCGIGNQKDAFFARFLAQKGVETFGTTIALIDVLRSLDVRTGVFSASRHAREILTEGRLLDRFDAIVDGIDAEREGLPGKPDPATLLAVAHLLGVEPAAAVVVEDSIAGVRAGRAGGFRKVIGINRQGNRGRLLAAGAHVEVSDLGELDAEGMIG